MEILHVQRVFVDTDRKHLDSINSLLVEGFNVSVCLFNQRGSCSEQLFFSHQPSSKAIHFSFCVSLVAILAVNVSWGLSC